MSENKGCGCGKKNVEPTPPPAEQQAQPAQSEETAFRNAEAVEGGIKKN